MQTQDLTNVSKKVVKVLRKNQNVIVNNILNQNQEGIFAGLESKLEAAASYHAVAFHGIFKDFLGKFLSEDTENMGDETVSIWIRENVKKTINCMSGLGLNFKPTGKLKEGETLDFRGSFV